jgi:hypothetical protein
VHVGALRSDSGVLQSEPISRWKYARANGYAVGPSSSLCGNRRPSVAWRAFAERLAIARQLAAAVDPARLADNNYLIPRTPKSAGHSHRSQWGSVVTSAPATMSSIGLGGLSGHRGQSNVAWPASKFLLIRRRQGSILMLDPLVEAVFAAVCAPESCPPDHEQHHRQQ